ncbi:MAG: amino acid ABC transporter permease [SAR202 cluster bacterium]|nr:amino acid ABC transporter permease [SAR202 cluster bacterium]|tara:strand:- start:6192 stop:6980 length:789 start_codon:yes stop_codon:yes gene_type:complete
MIKRVLNVKDKKTVINFFILFIIIAILIYFADLEKLQETMFKPEIIVDQFPKIITQAAKNTLIFTIAGFAGGSVLGLILALMKLSKFTFSRIISSIYIDCIRGLPAILILIFIAYGLPIAFGVRIPGAYSKGILALSVVSSAYIAEVIRSGIEAIPQGQGEAAEALGMGKITIYSNVILPQAFRIMIPPFTNELVLLLKDTALISVIGVTSATKELTRFGRDGVMSDANATPLVVTGFIYLILTIPLTRLASYLEKKLSHKD